MDESQRAPAREPANQSQVSRAQRGVVAGYIHQLSERHSSRPTPRSGTQLQDEPGEGA
jgi:hypothetical protein